MSKQMDMENKEILDIADGTEVMFNYLRDTIYNPQKASLKFDSLPDDLKEFGEALELFCQMVMEAKHFAVNISKGYLDAKHPSRDNEFAAPLKALLASLKHLTWQAKQVASGDYHQKVDFMGEFADAFNDMTTQLKQRREALENEADASRRQALYLERSNSLFRSIMGNMTDLIIVMERTTGDVLYTNNPPQNLLANDGFQKQLNDILFEYAQNVGTGEEITTNSFTLISDTGLKHFSLTLYSISWDSKDAVACLLGDITKEQERLAELENAAYKDQQTGAYNRHYGMKIFDEWVESKEIFSVTFVDMDMLKYVNDVFGHNEGDVYIKSVITLLDAISNDAIVCRLGGDEFMVLAKDEHLPCDGLEAVFEDVRKKLVVSAPKDEHGVEAYSRSVSFGIVFVDKDNKLSATDLLSIADERMYQYKKAHKKERRN